MKSARMQVPWRGPGHPKFVGTVGQAQLLRKQSVQLPACHSSIYCSPVFRQATTQTCQNRKISHNLNPLSIKIPLIFPATSSF